MQRKESRTTHHTQWTRATWLNEVTSDSLHVHAEGQRRGNGDAGSCASILELTAGMGQGQEGALESLREPLSPSREAVLAAVGTDLRPEDCRAPLKPHPEFCLTQWGKLSPGLLKLKGDNFRQPRRDQGLGSAHPTLGVSSPVSHPPGACLGGGTHLPPVNDLCR